MLRAALPALLLMLGLMPGPLLPCSQARAAGYEPWVVYYHAELPAKAFFDYRLAVFDADRHPPLQPLFDRDILLLGYISFGEIENNRAGFEEAKQHGYVLMENAAWPGSYFVDVRDPRWKERVLRQAAAVWDQGFHGFFLDTLDNPPHLEGTDPQKYAGMTAAAADLVLALRAQYPKAKIMLNRGFELHERVAGAIDFLLAESTRTTLDSTGKSYARSSQADFETYLSRIRMLQQRNPKLQVMSLDYWNPDDVAGIKALYTEMRGHKMLPYIATPALDRVVPEPR